MGLQKCGLNINRVQKELIPHGTPEFPCAGYSDTLSIDDSIPWHWHEEMEIVYLKSGALKLLLASERFQLKTGECCIVNSNILHYAVAEAECELHSLVFSPLLITGTNDSIFAKKYMIPLISNKYFSGYMVKAFENGDLIDNFTSAFESLAADTADFEFTVREKLSQICISLYHQLENQSVIKDQALSLDNLRIREMLEYIHQNYVKQIALSEIAATANIGERECLRCFQRTIQLSPMQYLLKYRIMKGAALLLDKPSYSIAEISSSCGFDSPSNFAKMFKRFYICTPREYRYRKSTKIVI